jgi:hypothetical protein
MAFFAIQKSENNFFYRPAHALMREQNILFSIYGSYE